MGVRISWLMRERNSVLAWFACLAPHKRLPAPALTPSPLPDAQFLPFFFTDVTQGDNHNFCSAFSIETG